MRCAVCNKSSDETDLSEGIYGGEIVDVCKSCAELEGIPLIAKPTQEQLQQIDRRYSVRERMENISGAGRAKKLHLSKEQTIANKNLAKIKLPEKKQENEKLVENYYWVLQMGRRRKKLSLGQLSKQISIPIFLLEQIEKGQLPENFEMIMKILEHFLDIKLLKEHENPICYVMPDKTPEQQRRKIINQTKEKMHEADEKENIPEEKLETKKQIIQQIAVGKFDFSKRENLEKVTLSDLVDLKKQRDKKKMEKQKEKEHEDMFGGEVELEESRDE